jgi:hypothetical protein
MMAEPQSVLRQALGSSSELYQALKTWFGFLLALPIKARILCLDSL